MSRPRTVLYLDGDGLQAWSWRAGRLAMEAGFDAGSEGMAAFALWLGSRPESEYVLLADLPGEHYQVEDLPPLGRTDRQLLIARKRNQCSRGSPFVAELALGGKPRASRILLLVLTQPELIEPWLSALERHQAALRSVLTVPLLINQLGKHLAGASTYLLIACLTPAGIRHTLLEHGRLRFSRLQAWRPEQGEDYATACLHEATRLRPYLTSQRLLPHDAPLSLHILADADGQNADSGADFPATRIGLPALGSACKLRSPIPGHDALPLFLHLAARYSGGAQFAPAPARRILMLRRARSVILAGGVLALLAGLGSTGLLWQESADLREDTASLHSGTRQFQARHAALRASLPQLAASPTAMQLAVRHYDELAALPFGPLSAWQQVGTALAGHTGLALEQLEWSLGQPADTAATASPGEWQAPQSQRVEILLRSLSADPGDAALAQEAITESLRRIAGAKVGNDRSDGRQIRIHLELPLQATSP